jgi:trigger factor
MSHDHHDHSVDYKTAFTATSKPKSQVTLTGELPVEEIERERSGALATLGANIELPGFRKGHVPESILTKHIGEMRLWGEMCERAISHAYIHLIDVHELDVIGQPEIAITKIAPGNPLGCTITVHVVPTISLPDYRSIAIAENTNRASDTVSDEEVEIKIKEILRQKVAYERLQKKAADASAAADLPTPETVTSESELTLPELTDTVAQSLGKLGQFETVADFRAKLTEHLTEEKKREVAAAHRARVTDAIIAGTTVELPDILITSELQQMFSQMTEDLTRAHLSFDDYLTHSKKTRAELEAEWRPAAEKRATLQLVLNEIAKREHVTPSLDDVQREVDALTARFPDADERRVRLYVASVLTNEGVLNFLENLTA